MRVVSLSPSLTDILIRLGAANDIQAVTADCPEGVPSAVRVGNPKLLELSKIEALRPDLIFSDLADNRPEEIRILKQKFQVFSFWITSIEDVLQTVLKIGEILGKTPAAVDLNREIVGQADKNRKLKESGPGKRTLLLLKTQPFLTVNGAAYASSLIENSGGLNVFRDDPLSFFPIEFEDMMEKNPEVILLSSFGSEEAKRLRDYPFFSKAVIETVNEDVFFRYGPATAKALKELRGIFDSANVGARHAVPLPNNPQKK